MKMNYQIFNLSPTIYLWANFDTAFLRDSKKVLDVGCGTGDELITRNLSSDVTGIDISRHRCRQTKTKTGAEIICADGQLLPFISEVFDGVLSNQVIEHVNDDSSFLSEIRRVLKSRGKLAISTAKYSYTRKFIIRNYGIVRAFHGQFLDPTHLREYSYKGFSDLLKAFGFDILFFKGNAISFIIGYIDSAFWALGWKLNLSKQTEKILRLIYRFDKFPLPFWQTFSFACVKCENISTRTNSQPA